MSNIFLDGMDHVDPGMWTLASNMSYETSAPGPRTGTHYGALGTEVFGQTYRDFNSTEEDDGMTVGFGFNGGEHSSGALDLVRMSEGFGTTHHVILQRLSGSRGWSVIRANGTELISVLPNKWFYNTWHYIEMQVKIADAGGTVELRQDGATIGSFTGDTRNGGVDGKIDRVQFRQFTNAGAVRIDDVYINNEQGAAPDNGFWGDTRLYPSYPNGDGNYSQLLGSDGNSVNNSLLVDEAGVAVESDYVGSATDGQKDTYTFGDLPVSVGTVRAVQIRMHAWKTDTGLKGIRSLYRRSGTDTPGADHVLATVGAPYRETYALDPLTGVAWTIPNFNASEFGAEVRP